MIEGSFTVEAAMIMGIVLFVIISVLDTGWFVYERAVQTAKEYEIAISEEEEPNPVTYLRKIQWGKAAINEK